MVTMTRFAVYTAAVAYLSLLGYMFAVGLHESREIFYRIDPSLRHKGEEREYAEDCHIGLDNLGDKLDIFVLAHSLGYWAKMLVLRDHLMVWLVSLVFEHIEIALQHVLMNFRECWWDHILMDVFTCNFGGLLLGYATLKAFNIRTFPWWHGSLASPTRMFYALLGLTIMLTVDSSCFFLKYFLGHPPEHPVVFGRLVFWFAFALIGYTDFFDHVERVASHEASGAASAAPRMPFAAVFSMLTCFAEVVVYLRFAYDSTSIADGTGLATPMPLEIAVPLAAGCALLLLSAAALYLVRSRALAGVLFTAAMAVLTWSHFASMPGLDFKRDELRDLCVVVKDSALPLLPDSASLGFGEL
eukprot:TRINITY_DN21078_c0_g1_i1.p1 TRINITY_DN21078_c0_g1~~TRINITY_DN21078_c0_g1_i1.p1  ORF type:complete len:375 (+),score=150.40 TRINITY_DN21078_c0_g1_i1:55-1125(+)